MDDLRILYLGTSEFSATVLKGLLDANYNVIGVVSQCDKPVGRKKEIKPTPVKQVASEHNIPVYQFESLTENEKFIEDLKPDINISCAYGQKTSMYFNEYPKYKSINVHGSYLPYLRGGAPIHHAIIDGYKFTGVTIMSMGEKMDSGLMFSRAKMDILDSDDLESLSNRMQIVATNLLLESLPKIISGELKGEEQDPSLVTYGFTIKKEQEKIDFNKTAREVFNKIRGLCPNPGAYGLLNDKTLKIYKSAIVEEESNEKVGTIKVVNKDVIVYCGKGSIKLLDVQLQGKNRMDIKSFLNGNKEELKEIK